MGPLLLIAICAFVLCYIFYRIFPLTVLVILVMIGIICYISFGKGEQMSDSVTNAGAAAIIIAFVADVLIKFSRLFRRRELK